VTAVVGGAYVLIGASNASLGPVGDELRTSLRLSGAVTGLHGARSAGSCSPARWAPGCCVGWRG
jgi:hypothetical protein